MSLEQYNNKKVHRAWSLYDWANSAYNLVITSTIFPAYYIAITTTEDKGDKVLFLEFEIINSTLLNYSIALAYLIIAFLSPILSSIADVKGNKKNFMQLFTTLGALACCGLFFFTPDNLELGIGLAILAAIGYCGSIVFYNSYLPEIATPEQRNKLSAQGFAYGYIGSVLLQIICLAIVSISFDDKTFSMRLSFLLVGIWWIVFAQISFKYLPNHKLNNSEAKNNVFSSGFLELKKVWNEIKTQYITKVYLLSFFFYGMGVQTIMLAAAEFGKKEIKKNVDGILEPLATHNLIVSILLIQIVAIGGAWLMAYLAQKIGNIRVIFIALLIWIAICIAAYFTYYDYQFYILAFVVGLVMGGIQSISRATFSLLVPANEKDTTSYFSFYDVTEKLAIVAGMFSFALIEHITGNMRSSIILLALFFIIGLVFLLRIFHSKIGINKANNQR